MSEVVVIGAFTARPGKEQDAEAALTALIEPTHAEDGCIMYALHRGADDPSRFAFIERWASREQLDAHLRTDVIAAALARVDELFGAENAEITVYEPLPGGEPSKGSIAGHAGG